MLKRLPENRIYDLSEINILYKIYIPRKKIYTKVFTKLSMALQQSLERLENSNGYFGINAGSSFSIIGQSGSGKTSLIHACISEIGNDIKTIENDYMKADIIPFLYLNCPPDCSLKTLLLSILQEIDTKLHTHYADSYSLKFTTEQLFSTLKSAVQYVGVLILDECQNLAKFRAGNTLINYLTALANSGLSICLSATEELIPFLSSDSSLSRRYQPILIQPYDFDDDFKELANCLLSCQFHTIDIDDVLLYWLFIHSSGLPSQLVEIIYQANLSTDEEYLTIKDFENVFDNMVFKPKIIPMKSNVKKNTLCMGEVKGTNIKEPIDFIQIMKNKNLDMLSVLRANNYEVIEL